ncbi:hypothetical protein L798_04742 [Zootermopsis nevadensis]|uniref:Uncharacterized protein n=1 Tax=Zootermopsis nevadensis TaxID=136037 RepID=A0A067RAM8_ZOONE|nr:hypothetical protein L798_04742 [Zootermopsis nevadensis]
MQTGFPQLQMLRQDTDLTRRGFYFHINNNNMKACAYLDYDKLFKVKTSVDTFKASFLETEIEPKWRDNKSVSSYRGRNAVEAVKWLSEAQKKHTEVPRRVIKIQLLYGRC